MKLTEHELPFPHCPSRVPVVSSKISIQYGVGPTFTFAVAVTVSGTGAPLPMVTEPLSESW